MDARCDLRVLVDELKISARPSRAKPHDFWWCTVVVALLRWERRVFAIEAAWQIRAIDAETFLRGVDRHFGVHLQEVGFFFSSRRRHTRWNCDWSSDVCSSD